MPVVLASLLALAAPACLITSVPVFDDPAASAPVLLPDRTDPDPRGIVVLDASAPSQTFSAFVTSQDAGRPLEVRLLLDYGSPNDLGRPFRLVSPGPSLEPGALDDGPRPVRVTWTPGTLPRPPGCHRLTLMVSHEFDDGGTGCPASPDDYAQLTWLVQKCDELGCPAVDLSRTKQSDDDPSCPPVVAACGSLEAAGGGAP